MPEKRNRFGSLEAGGDVHLMRAFSKMDAVDRTEFIEMAEGRAGSVENYIATYVQKRGWNAVASGAPGRRRGEWGTAAASPGRAEADPKPVPGAPTRGASRGA